MTESNDERLLPFIPGPILAAAMKVLPDAESVSDQFREVQVVVTIRYERMSSRHGKLARRYFWTPDHATIKFAE